MNIHFLGAARTVTGSMHLIETNGHRILLDTGLFQGPRKEAAQRNASFPFDPADITAVVLSHAHIDHSGNLPTLVKKGFKGTIYATPATRDLLGVMLPDSAHIQQKEAEFLGRKKRSFVEPLYTPDDAARTLQHVVAVPKNRTFYVCDDVKATFHNAGHILGAAGTVVEVAEHSNRIRIGYSGDVGHEDKPLLKPNDSLPSPDVLILESTYGDKCHIPSADRKQRLLDIVKDAYARGGKVIIPAFSVGRTQQIVHVLHELFDAGKLPAIPIFVDSPLSVNVTDVFRIHREEIDDSAFQNLQEDEDPFGFYRLTYVHKVEDSIALNERKDPCVIITASGMCEAGRVLHHLKNTIDDERNTILIVGYMAQHTLGYRLINGDKEVNILGKRYPVRAKIDKLNSFSAHADQPELVLYARRCNRQGSLRAVFLVHGELPRCEVLKQALIDEGIPDPYIPELGESCKVNG